MKLMVACLLLATSFVAQPALAQRPPDAGQGNGAIQSLANELAALTGRVAKLEGNIVASDLAGTYEVTVIANSMTSFHAGTPPTPATINTTASRATMRVNADGTGRFSDFTCEGSTLIQGTWAVLGFGCSEAGGNITWTYANGVFTFKDEEGEEIPLTVALGGRLLIAAFAPFHPSDPSSDQFMVIATRLR